MATNMVRRMAVVVSIATLAMVLGLCGCSSGSGGASSASAGSNAQAASTAAAGSFDAALNAALDYARGLDIAEGEGYEWPALSLARAGDDVSAPPLSDFSKSMAAYVKSLDGVMDEYNSTAYSKAIIALTSVGVDASDVEGFNLLQGISDLDFITFQGVNGPIWALIALDSNAAYTVPENAEAKTPTTRDGLVKALLDAQGKDGGWSLMGMPDDKGTVDLTAMALTALSPYADGKQYPEVPEAVERGLAFLSEAQLADGGFDGGSGETSESASQVVIALCSLGIDPGTDERFAKGGTSVLDNLIGFQGSTGAFAHELGSPANDVASDQACEALVAVYRLRAGLSPLYAM